MIKIGFIINPIAGMGGKVALKGTDGSKILQEAIKRGASPVSIKKAELFFEGILTLPAKSELIFLVPHGKMGEKLFLENQTLKDGINVEILTQISIPPLTSSKDTMSAAAELKRLNVDLIVFVGGDGTAQDIYTSIGTQVPILGIPSGVKIHSGVFAQSTSKAVDIINKFSQGQIEFSEAEIIDLDEEAFRNGIIKTKLYGVGLVPQIPSLMQLTKSHTYQSNIEEDNIEGIIRTLSEDFSPDIIYILGSGSTIKNISRFLGQEVFNKKSLLGIDIVFDGKITSLDVSEKEILDYLEKNAENKKKLLITPIGGQGFILGRGNQQLSPKVIEMISISSIQVIATKSKVESVPNRIFHVDTGDPKLDRLMTGFQRVLVDYNEYWMISVN